jgi:hypothetical protein
MAGADGLDLGYGNPGGPAEKSRVRRRTTEVWPGLVILVFIDNGRA